MIQLTIAEWLNEIQSPELRYAVLIVLLFVVPRILSRFGTPLAISAFFMGVFSSVFLQPLKGDVVVSTFAFLGISSLFLFAGLEVVPREIRRNSGVIIQHIAVRLVTMAILVVALVGWLDLTTVQASIMSLALLTPSTGFIIDSIESSKMSDGQKSWVKNMAISAEVVALFFLVLLSRAHRPLHMLISIGVILLLIIALPRVFRILVKRMKEIAPGTEFGMMILMAVVMGLVTKALGAYYLVGAFVVGIVAGRFRREEHNLATEEHLKAIRLFASFFMPFYFFSAGIRFEIEYLNWTALSIAGILLVVTLPVKIISVIAHRNWVLKEKINESFPIAVSLLPTLIFGLVLADILLLEFNISKTTYSAIIIHTMVLSLSPMIIFRFFPYKEIKEISTIDPVHYRY